MIVGVRVNELTRPPRSSVRDGINITVVVITLMAVIVITRRLTVSRISCAGSHGCSTRLNSEHFRFGDTAIECDWSKRGTIGVLQLMRVREA